MFLEGDRLAPENPDWHQALGLSQIKAHGGILAKNVGRLGGCHGVQTKFKVKWSIEKMADSPGYKSVAGVFRQKEVH